MSGEDNGYVNLIQWGRTKMINIMQKISSYWKLLNVDTNFGEVCFEGPNWQKVIHGTANVWSPSGDKSLHVAMGNWMSDVYLCQPAEMGWEIQTIIANYVSF